MGVISVLKNFILLVVPFSWSQRCIEGMPERFLRNFKGNIEVPSCCFFVKVVSFTNAVYETICYLLVPGADYHFWSMAYLAIVSSR